jgi:hypothetical protein
MQELGQWLSLSLAQGSRGNLLSSQWGWPQPPGYPGVLEPGVHAEEVVLLPLEDGGAALAFCEVLGRRPAPHHIGLLSAWE